MSFYPCEYTANSGNPLCAVSVLVRSACLIGSAPLAAKPAAMAKERPEYARRQRCARLKAPHGPRMPMSEGV